MMNNNIKNMDIHVNPNVQYGSAQENQPTILANSLYPMRAEGQSNIPLSQNSPNINQAEVSMSPNTNPSQNIIPTQASMNPMQNNMNLAQNNMIPIQNMNLAQNNNMNLEQNNNTNLEQNNMNTIQASNNPIQNMNPTQTSMNPTQASMNPNLNLLENINQNQSQNAQENKNVILGFSKEEQNDPNIVLGIGNKDELSKDNHLYYNLISLFPLEYEDSKMVENNRNNIISQIKKYIIDNKPELENIKVKVISSEPYTNISQLTDSIKENREGSVMTSHMTEQSEQHSEKYNYVIEKRNKKKSNKKKQNGGKQSKKNKYQTGGQVSSESASSEPDNIFEGIENTDNTVENYR